MPWNKVKKTFTSEGEREFFRLLLEKSAKAADLFIRNVHQSTNGNHGREVSEYYFEYEVADGTNLLKREEILGSE